MDETSHLSEADSIILQKVQKRIADSKAEKHNTADTTTEEVKQSDNNIAEQSKDDNIILQKVQKRIAEEKKEALLLEKVEQRMITEQCQSQPTITADITPNQNIESLALETFEKKIDDSDVRSSFGKALKAVIRKALVNNEKCSLDELLRLEASNIAEYELIYAIVYTERIGDIGLIHTLQTHNWIQLHTMSLMYRSLQPYASFLEYMSPPNYLPVSVMNHLNSHLVKSKAGERVIDRYSQWFPLLDREHIKECIADPQIFFKMAYLHNFTTLEENAKIITIFAQCTIASIADCDFLVTLKISRTQLLTMKPIDFFKRIENQLLRRRPLRKPAQKQYCVIGFCVPNSMIIRRDVYMNMVRPECTVGEWFALNNPMLSFFAVELLCYTIVDSQYQIESDAMRDKSINLRGSDICPQILETANGDVTEAFKKTGVDSSQYCDIYKRLLNASQKCTYDDIIHMQWYYHGYLQNCKEANTCQLYINVVAMKHSFDEMRHVITHFHPPLRYDFTRLADINPLAVIAPGLVKGATAAFPNEIKRGYDHRSKYGWLPLLLCEIIRNKFGDFLTYNSRDASLQTEAYYSQLLSKLESIDCNEEKCDFQSVINVETIPIWKLIAEKYNCAVHKKMGFPLSYDEILALLLYTNCDCNYEMCFDQRFGKYQKWPIFDRTLSNAISALGPLQKLGDETILYCGLSNVFIEPSLWSGPLSDNAQPIKRDSMQSLQSLSFLSFSWDKAIAERYRRDRGVIIRTKASEIDPIYRCDVSWISAYRTEKEILVSRHLGWICPHQTDTPVRGIQSVQIMAALRHVFDPTVPL